MQYNQSTLLDRAHKFSIRRLDYAFGRLYDSRKSIRTEFVQYPDELEINSPNIEHAVEYQPTPSFLFRSMLAPVEGPFSDLTFIDLGCGPGRTLFLAHDLGFKRCVGVELSPLLCRAAEENISNSPAATREAIEIVQADATNFAFPNDDYVIFMFEPFEQEVMKQVAQNIVPSSSKPRSRATIIYYHPSSDWIFANNDAFVRLKYSVWQKRFLAMFAEHDVSAFAIR